MDSKGKTMSERFWRWNGVFLPVKPAEASFWFLGCAIGLR